MLFSDKLKLEDDSEFEFVWLSNCKFCSSYIFVLVGDKFDLQLNIVFVDAALFCSIWANDGSSHVLLLLSVVEF